MEIASVFVTGTFEAGITTFIGSISEIGVVITDELVSIDGGPREVGMDYGRITFDAHDVLYFFGNPCSLWFHPGFLRPDALGVVILVDSANPASFKEARRTFEIVRTGASVPYIIAANKQDLPDAWEPEMIRLALKCTPNELVVPCVATDRESVKQVLIALLHQVLDRLPPADG